MNPLANTIEALCHPERGVLAADEDLSSLERKFNKIGITSTQTLRQQYREWLFTTEGIEQYLSGAILHEETIWQSAACGNPYVEHLENRGIVPGIKMDRGRQPLPLHPNETLTLGLDDLRHRLTGYADRGLRFAKWRAAFQIGKTEHPSQSAIRANCEAMAIAAAFCHERYIVPFVEPDILTSGPHDIARCEDVTTNILRHCIEALTVAGVSLEYVIIKTNMVTSGVASGVAATADDVAGRTLRCLRSAVPAAVPAIMFLSGGQSSKRSTTNLQAINAASGPKPWRLSFSFGRALRDDAFIIWSGQDANVPASQADFRNRAKLGALASMGKYSENLEHSAL